MRSAKNWNAEFVKLFHWHNENRIGRLSTKKCFIFNKKQIVKMYPKCTNLHNIRRVVKEGREGGCRQPFRWEALDSPSAFTFRIQTTPWTESEAPSGNKHDCYEPHERSSTFSFLLLQKHFHYFTVLTVCFCSMVGVSAMLHCWFANRIVSVTFRHHCCCIDVKAFSLFA